MWIHHEYLHSIFDEVSAVAAIIIAINIGKWYIRHSTGMQLLANEILCVCSTFTLSQVICSHFVLIVWLVANGGVNQRLVPFCKKSFVFGNAFDFRENWAEASPPWFKKRMDISDKRCVCALNTSSIWLYGAIGLKAWYSMLTRTNYWKFI